MNGVDVDEEVRSVRRVMEGEECGMRTRTRTTRRYSSLYISVQDYRREPIDILRVRCESFLSGVVNRAKEFASNLELSVVCERTEEDAQRVLS